MEKASGAPETEACFSRGCRTRDAPVFSSETAEFDISESLPDLTSLQHSFKRPWCEHGLSNSWRSSRLKKQYLKPERVDGMDNISMCSSFMLTCIRQCGVHVCIPYIPTLMPPAWVSRLRLKHNAHMPNQRDLVPSNRYWEQIHLWTYTYDTREE